MTHNITWDQMIFGTLFATAPKSKDPNTQLACAIVNHKHQIISTGFNSPARDLPDDMVPKNRPEDDSKEAYYQSKYPWMIHAERNAIRNANVDVWGCTAYITTWPCHDCACNELWHNGVRDWVILNSPLAKCVADKNNQDLVNKFYKMTEGKLTIRVVHQLDLSYLDDVTMKLRYMGFIQ